MKKIDIIYDMETQDPDDFFTLCFLTSHPNLELRAVTITPGSRHQVDLVKQVLSVTDHSHVPVGARNPDHPKPCISSFHYKIFPKVKPAEPDGSGKDVLYHTWKKYPEMTFLTGAALHNLRLLMNEYPEVVIEQWVGQGGFAGDSVVDPEHRLEKFAGLETCPTFNFNGDPKGAKLLLASDRVKFRRLVSKNVCHGVVYDQRLHSRVEPHRKKTPGLDLIYQGMEIYLNKNSSGKKFHDPLAACCVIDPEICQFREVEVYRAKGKWGSRRQTGTNTVISVAVDWDRFVDTLVTT